jgi:hypothetical protein
VGVLPLCASLLARGIPLTPVLVFTFASPLIKPTTFLITIAFLGIEFALWLLAATVVIGLTLGFLMDSLLARGWLHEAVQDHVLGHNGPAATTIPASSGAHGRPWTLWARVAAGDILRNARFVGKYILLALGLQVLLKQYVPPSLIMALAGAQHSHSVVLATVLGIPLYVNAASGPPLLAGLLGLGMARGAALGFMITGTAYSIPSLVTLMTILKGRSTAVFLAVGFAGGLSLGYLYQLFAQ